MSSVSHASVSSKTNTFLYLVHFLVWATAILLTTNMIPLNLFHIAMEGNFFFGVGVYALAIIVSGITAKKTVALMYVGSDSANEKLTKRSIAINMGIFIGLIAGVYFLLSMILKSFGS